MALNDTTNEMVRKEYLALLKERLEYHCNKDMCCEIYWDYRDEIVPSTLKEAADKYKEAGYENPKDYLVEKLYELNFDYDSYMFNEIKSDILNCENEHVVEYFEAHGNLYEDALTVGYNGVDVNVDKILGKSSFCINIMFATETERDYDMGSIVSAFGSYREPDFEYLSKNTEVLDNAVTYFIHQQGHSVKEVYDCLLANPRGFGSDDETNFAEAIVNDIVNNSSEAMSELTALVKLNGNEYFELLEAIDKGEQCLSFGKETDIGIFNEWVGTGGLLEFQLDKPFVVPVDMVRNVQVEGSKPDWGYTVDSVYRLIGSCWKETLSYTDEKPDLFKEDLAETVKVAKSFLNPFELKKHDRNYDFIASIQNNTDSTLSFSFDDSLGIERFKIKPNDWVGLLHDEDGLATLDAIENGNYTLEFVKELEKDNRKPGLDDVIHSCEEMSKMGVSQDEKHRLDMDER